SCCACGAALAKAGCRPPSTASWRPKASLASASSTGRRNCSRNSGQPHLLGEVVAHGDVRLESPDGPVGRKLPGEDALQEIHDKVPRLVALAWTVAAGHG